MADRSGSGEAARLHAATVAEHAALAVLQVIGAAEELVAGARVVHLLELQIGARRRHAEAALTLLKALEAGSRDTADAGRRATVALAESERVCGEGVEEMVQITEAGTDRFDLLVDQYGRWADAADAEFYAQLQAGQ